LGGWSAFLALRGRIERQIADARILGDEDFVKKVLADMDDIAKGGT
jgi:hypothetical protein